MHTFFADYLKQLDILHAGMIEVIDGVPPEALDWSPGEGVNSIAVLIAHIAGSERYWIGDVALQEPKPRDRAAEFRTRGLSAADLKRRIEETGAYAHDALARLTLDDLGLMRPPSQPGGETHSVAYALAHALAHAAIHAGHLQVMRDWWLGR